MRKKKFDCLEMKQKGSRKIHLETKDLTLKQEVKYWRLKSEQMMARHGQAAPPKPEKKPAAPSLKSNQAKRPD